MLNYLKKKLIYFFGLNKYIFRKKYLNNEWGDSETFSGSGSNIENTLYLLPQIEELIKHLNVKIFLDIPSGDFNWMKNLNFQNLKYIGGDIVPELIRINNRKYSDHSISFVYLDLLTDLIPEADLLFIRDCLVHLSYKDIKKVIANIQRSKVKYIVMTTFTDLKINSNIKTGDWRPINLELSPFSFPRPEMYLYEDCREAEGRYNDKKLGVWTREMLSNI